MSDNLRETKPPEEQDHSHDSGWLSRLNDLQKLVAAIAAVVASLGTLGTAAYVAQDSWEKAFGMPGSAPAPGPASPALRTSPPVGTPSSLTSSTPATSPTGPGAPGPTSATLSPSTPPRAPTPSPRQPGTLGYGHISSIASSGGSCVPAR